MALARVSMSVGARAASHAVGGLFANEADKGDRLKDLLFSQIGTLTRELGELKGSLMKVGQMISMYGEHFLPPEANNLLKSLQSQSPPLEWAAIEKIIRRHLGPEKMAELEIDPVPLASASLGQVHRARVRDSGRELALKVQYPGVDQAIDSDIATLRKLLSMAKLIPGGPRYEELFREVRAMLHQEVDYRKELEATDFFRQALADDPRFIVAETFPEFSTARVIATSYETGIALDSDEVLGLPQERRNALGLAALELYYRELFDLHLVQTDPHFGNYRVRLGEGGQPDRLILLDFGAVRKVPQTFLKNYRRMVRGALNRDPGQVHAAAEALGFLQAGDPDELREIFVELCELIVEPFQEGVDAGGQGYDWAKSDLPQRVAKVGTRMAFLFKLRQPPREVVFLDRKMGGVFILLKVLRARFPVRGLLEKYLNGEGFAG